MIKPYTRAEICFEIIKEIGQDGKNSQVHLVHDKQIDDDIVVKVLAKSSIGNVDEYFDEARRLYTSKHSNVVQIYYACEDTDNIFIAMPFYSNGSLKNILSKRYLTIREVLRYSIQFLSGLHNIHSKKLIHFDIKPDNILIDHRNEALISDFGQSKRMSCTGLAEQDRLYLKQRSPESLGHDIFDIKQDIYQVGVTLYRLVNGNQMFYNQYSKYCDTCGCFADRDSFFFDVRNGHFPNRDMYLDHVPRKLRKIINKCISINPDDRYRNCLELINELSEIDHSLDWQYSITGSTKEWISDRDDRVMRLTHDGTKYYAEKKMKESGKVYKIKDFCNDSLSQKDLYTFFKEV